MSAYDSRKRFIERFLATEIQDQYAPPANLSEEALRRDLANMRDDLVREWPMLTTDEQMAEHARKVMAEVRRRHSTRTWPTAKVMLEALASVAVTIKATGIAPRAREVALSHAERIRIRAEQEDAAVIAWSRGERDISAGLLTDERLSRLKAQGLVPASVDLGRCVTAAGLRLHSGDPA